MQSGRIRLSQALNLMDEKVVEGCLQKFDVEWVAKNGEKIRLTSAMKCGLKPGVDRTRYIGLRSTENDHHVHTVEIHTILSFDAERVFW